MFDATLWLPNVAMINVYDHSGEFWTTDAVDFVYLEQTKEAKTVMLAEWMHPGPRDLRAQWFRDEEAETMLKDIGSGRKIEHLASVARNLDLRKDTF